MINHKERFPNLYQFLGSYFNQSWKEFYDWKDATPNFEAVVNYYKSISSTADIRQVSKELRDFLALSIDEKDFEVIVRDEFFVWFTLRSRGMNKRQWLEAVLKILDEPTKHSDLRFIG